MRNLASSSSQPFFYKGQSMTPTFRPGDILYVRQPGPSIVPGDVIVFQSTREAEPVVHRVVRVAASQYITRGDNNRTSDPIPISGDEIIGHVVAREFGSKIRRVRGGRRGLMAAQIGWTTRGLTRQLRWLLWRPYHSLRDSSLSRAVLDRLLRGAVTTIRLESPEGPIVKTAFYGRTVALYYPDQNRFICRKPFDLFISPPNEHR